jgi:hypothetical protein
MVEHCIMMDTDLESRDDCIPTLNEGSPAVQAPRAGDWVAREAPGDWVSPETRTWVSLTDASMVQYEHCVNQRAGHVVVCVMVCTFVISHIVFLTCVHDYWDGLLRILLYEPWRSAFGIMAVLTCSYCRLRQGALHSEQAFDPRRIFSSSSARLYEYSP